MNTIKRLISCAILFYCVTGLAKTTEQIDKEFCANQKLIEIKQAMRKEQNDATVEFLKLYCNEQEIKEILAKIDHVCKLEKEYLFSDKGMNGTHDKNVPENITKIIKTTLLKYGINPNKISIKDGTAYLKGRGAAAGASSCFLDYDTYKQTGTATMYINLEYTKSNSEEKIIRTIEHEITHIMEHHTTISGIIKNELLRKNKVKNSNTIDDHEKYVAISTLHERSAELFPACHNLKIAKHRYGASLSANVFKYKNKKKKTANHPHPSQSELFKDSKKIILAHGKKISGIKKYGYAISAWKKEIENIIKYDLKN